MDIAGFLAAGAAGPRLVEADLRTVETLDTALAPRRAARLPVVASVAALRSLSREEAARGYPVSFEAVVTFSDPDEPALFVQDGNDAVYVFAPGLDFPVASRVHVEGFSGPGSLAPIVVTPRVRALGRASLPPVRRVGAARLSTGEDDCRRVEVSGVVRSAEIRGNRVDLTLSSEGVALDASLLRTPGGPGPEALVDAEVRVRGVCQTRFDWRGQLAGVRLNIARPQDVELERPATPLPFGLPLTPVADLLRVRGGVRWGHRRLCRGRRPSSGDGTQGLPARRQLDDPGAERRSPAARSRRPHRGRRLPGARQRRHRPRGRRLPSAGARPRARARARDDRRAARRRQGHGRRHPACRGAAGRAQRAALGSAAAVRGRPGQRHARGGAAARSRDRGGEHAGRHGRRHAGGRARRHGFRPAPAQESAGRAARGLSVVVEPDAREGGLAPRSPPSCWPRSAG